MTSGQPTVGERLYVWLVRLLPGPLPDEARAEMRAVFRDGLAAARRRGLGARLWFWALTLYDLLVLRLRPESRPRSSLPASASMIETLSKDLRYAARTLLKAPGFTLTVVVTLALGIGANTAIFSVVDGILLRPLPFAEPAELVVLWADHTERGGPEREWLSYPDFHDARQLGVFQEFGAWGGWYPTLTGQGDGPERLTGALVTQGTLADVLATEPTRGRTFLPEEDRPGAERTVLISHDFWTRSLDADPGVLGRTLSLNEQPFTVIGVMPPGFRPPFRPEAQVWATFRTDMSEQAGNRGNISYRSVGRLADGVDLETARAALHTLESRLRADYPETNGQVRFNLVPLHSDMVAVASTALWVLLGAVAFVLLMACVNVANLLLAQSTSRSGELAVRSALGASRGRIVRQLLGEGMLLAALGGILGALLGWGGTRLLVSLAPPGTPRIEEVGVDLRVLGFTAAATVISAILFGLLPALQASRTDLRSALHEGGRGHERGSGGHAIRAGLVVVQVALALVLLVGAGLMTRTFRQLQAVDLGFDPDDVLTLALGLPPERYAERQDRADFFREMELRLTALPGVEAAGATNSLPLAGNDGDSGFHVEGAPVPDVVTTDHVAWVRPITSGFLDAMGISVVAGRDFRPGDDAQAPLVVIVNETLVRRHFGDDSPLGRRINFGSPEEPNWREIVGVAADVKQFGIDDDARNAVYLPHEQVPFGFMTFVLRVEEGRDPTALAASVRREVAEFDPNLAVAGVATMREVVQRSLATERFVMSLMGAFAGIALVLAVIGLYGVVSYGVRLRSREMGVRVALGAGAGDIRRLVVGGSLGLVGLGAVIGVGGALLLTRLMESLLFEVEPTDPMTFGSGVLVLAAATLVASLVPARRAARVDPVEVLNRE